METAGVLAIHPDLVKGCIGLIADSTCPQLGGNVCWKALCHDVAVWTELTASHSELDPGDILQTI